MLILMLQRRGRLRRGQMRFLWVLLIQGLMLTMVTCRPICGRIQEKFPVTVSMMIVMALLMMFMDGTFLTMCLEGVIPKGTERTVQVRLEQRVTMD